MAERHGSRRREVEDHHERPADPAETAGRTMEDKDPGEAGPGPGHEPGAGEAPDLDRSPYEALNRPVGEPDETADSDPYGD